MNVPRPALAIVLAIVTFVPCVEGAIIWNGPSVGFTNVSGSDPGLAENQDRITPVVWITRGGSQGIFNAYSESGFQHFFSPADTEWANGTTANYSTLSYTDWNTWVRGVNPSPPSTVGLNAVVHLISEDIYIDIKFTFWPVGSGFAYIRSTPPPLSVPPVIEAGGVSGDGTFKLTFTNAPGYRFAVLSTTNLTDPVADWQVVGEAGYTIDGPGTYEFVDAAATNSPQQYYSLRWP